MKTNKTQSNKSQYTHLVSFIYKENWLYELLIRQTFREFSLVGISFICTRLDKTAIYPTRFGSYLLPITRQFFGSFVKQTRVIKLNELHETLVNLIKVIKPEYAFGGTKAR